ncbi:MAG: hypothetical protein GY799_15360 [Desulfobulbaceae bacterium]|nr:hypothetical protein [Desulfobulbaceae bacterium]
MFAHIHLMKKELQEKLIKILASNICSHVDSPRQLAMQSRIAFVSTFSIDYLESTGKLLPELLALFEKQHFNVPPLRNHKEDLPRLVSHYLGRSSKEYGVRISKRSVRKRWGYL